VPPDFLIVGSGLTGATIARHLHDAGHRVEVLEARGHVGGNVHDTLQRGIRVHTYGPHYFRTNNPRIWAFVNRFASWWRYEPCLQTEVDGELFPWPPTADVVRRFDDGWRWEGVPVDFETACLASMPERVYRLFVEPYTRKQWGTTDLTPDLAGRFDVRDTDLRLKRHRYQGIPVEGYAEFTERLLEDIPVHLNTRYGGERAGHVVYTGPIDAWFGHDAGRLAYRGQLRTHSWHQHRAQPCGQVNNPGPGDHIRTLEWAWMQPNPPSHSIVTTETPYTPTDQDCFEYPVPDQANTVLADLYRKRAKALQGVTICGRLGEYRYYDMDQAIGRAMRIASRLTRMEIAA
jgi:UDP-galactopyranose mutase